MAMGRREDQQKQEPLWIAHTELASAPGHPFYEKLNELLDAERFDPFVEGLSAKFYASRFGRPSLLPGIYFRSLLIGYFEGIEAERGIAWRIADSLGLRCFLGIALTEATPDHSTLSRTRRLIDLETEGQAIYNAGSGGVCQSAERLPNLPSISGIRRMVPSKKGIPAADAVLPHCLTGFIEASAQSGGEELS